MLPLRTTGEASVYIVRRIFRSNCGPEVLFKRRRVHTSLVLHSGSDWPGACRSLPSDCAPDVCPAERKDSGKSGGRREKKPLLWVAPSPDLIRTTTDPFSGFFSFIPHRVNTSQLRKPLRINLRGTAGYRRQRQLWLFYLEFEDGFPCGRPTVALQYRKQDQSASCAARVRAGAIRDFRACGMRFEGAALISLLYRTRGITCAAPRAAAGREVSTVPIAPVGCRGSACRPTLYHRFLYKTRPP